MPSRSSAGATLSRTRASAASAAMATANIAQEARSSSRNTRTSRSVRNTPSMFSRGMTVVASAASEAARPNCSVR